MLIKKNLFIFSVIFFILILFNNVFARSNNQDINLYLKKLEQFEKSQKEIDLIFSEYCYFHNDPICYEKTDNDNQNNTKQIDTSEINAQIYFTTTNVNLREKPNTKSKVLSVINKNETVKVYEVSNENPNWFLVEYQNFQGFIFSDYLSKEKQIVSNNILEDSENNDFNLNEIDWQPILDEALNLCMDDYLGVDSFNRLETHENYCACYSKGFKDIHTVNDIIYLDENDNYSDQFYTKENEMAESCADKFNFVFEYNDETKEAIKDQIKICKSDYKDNSVISKLDYYDWCKCYHNKSFIIYIEDVVENPDAESISKTTEKKLEKLENSCLSEIGN